MVNPSSPQHDNPPSLAAVEAHEISDFNGDGNFDGDGDGFEGLPVIADDQELLKRGVCRVPIPEELDTERWADELSQATPMNLGFEGDGEYAFYRNILDEPEFPFDAILLGGGGISEIGRSIARYFPILPDSLNANPSETDDLHGILLRELRLDDAFCVHYNMDQGDTTGAKHMDPSDVTVNMCLHKSKDAKGSYVLFHGIKTLENPDTPSTNCATDRTNSRIDPVDSPDAATANIFEGPTLTDTPERSDRFLVPQVPGYATIHFGDHPHETTALRRGSRTNIILTYVYTDPTRSDATFRSCY